MKWVWRGVGFTIAVAAAVASIGYLLPVTHEASRSAEFSQPPEAVFALISNLDTYPAWWPENDAKVEVLEASPPSRFVTRIVGETAFGGTWTWQIDNISTGSRVTITERGEIYNPMFRTLARFVFGYTSTMESCLNAARVKLNTSD